MKASSLFVLASIPPLSPISFVFLTSLSNMTLSCMLFVVSSSNCKLDNNKLGNNNMDNNNKLVDNNNMERENVDHSAHV